MRNIFGLITVFILALLIVSCTENNNVTNISKTGDKESHNLGYNCMQCHVTKGSGKGWFTVAGTAYQSDKKTPAPNGFVKLYDQLGGAGNLIATIQIDGLGNFFTTEAINFGSGLYPVVESSLGYTSGMGSSITTGACNSCHGQSTDKIFISNTGNITNISVTGGTLSHNFGKNCMQCHVNSGSGKGWFIVAGTLYKTDLTTTNPNGFVKLFDQPDGGGNLIATIQVDGLGNFYTTETINFGSGLYPSVENASGIKEFMGSKSTTGACNSCHGQSTDRINVQ